MKVQQLPDPHISLNQALRNIVDTWDPDAEEPEILVERLRKVFKENEWNLRTMSTYMTSIRKLGVFTGKFVNPEQFLELKQWLDKQQPHSFDTKLFVRELKEYKALSYNNRSKVWENAKRQKKIGSPLTPFQKALIHSAFYRDFIFEKWTLDVLKEGDHQLLLQHNQEAKQTQLNEIIFISKPNLFQQTLLSGLFSDDKSKLWPALCFCCGRRPSTLYLHAENFQEDPHVGPFGYACEFQETFKPGLRTVPMKGTLVLLAPWILFRRALDRYLTHFQGLQTVADVNHKRSDQDSKWVRRRTGMNLTSRDLRGIYAKYASTIFARDKHTAVWISQALFHHNLLSVFNYERVKFGGLGDASVTKWVPPFCEPPFVPTVLPDLPPVAEEEDPFDTRPSVLPSDMKKKTEIDRPQARRFGIDLKEIEPHPPRQPEDDDKEEQIPFLQSFVTLPKRSEFHYQPPKAGRPPGAKNKK